MNVTVPIYEEEEDVTHEFVFKIIISHRFAVSYLYIRSRAYDELIRQDILHH